MKLYIPKGGEMTDLEKDQWIQKVNILTESFHKNEIPCRYPLDMDKYLILKVKSKYKRFITDMWQKHYDRAEKLCFENNKELLSDDMMRYAYFLTGGGIWQKLQIPYLESKWDEKQLKHYLLEDAFMCPDITSEKYLSSETMINHLTHLTVFKEKTGADVFKFNTIVEFGGGYGGMCRLLRRFNNKSTYIIIDLPIFLIIQKFYLSNILGEENVNLFISDSQDIQKGKINLVDIGDEATIKLISQYKPDIFIAAWSLSESNKMTQDYIYEHNYFNANYILIGYRHYDKINPDQPCSNAIKLTNDFINIYENSAFYAIEKEQWYCFGKKENKT